MEFRVQRLEESMLRIEALLKGLDDRMGKLDERMRNVEVDIAEMKGRMTHLPSMWAMLTAIMGGQIAFGAVMATIFRAAGLH